MLSEKSYTLIFSLYLPFAPEERTFKELLQLSNLHFRQHQLICATRSNIYVAFKHPEESIKNAVFEFEA